MALFQFMMYPLSANVSMCTTWMLPFSVPTYSHLLATGRCKHVILQRETERKINRNTRQLSLTTYKPRRPLVLPSSMLGCWCYPPHSGTISNNYNQRVLLPLLLPCLSTCCCYCNGNILLQPTTSTTLHFRQTL